MPSNAKISESFNALVPTNGTKTYLDRFMDLAVYLNESMKDSPGKEDLLDDLEVMMTRVYTLEGAESEGETSDTNSSTEEVPSDSERPSSS